MPSLVLSRLPKLQNCSCSSMRLASLTSRPIRWGTLSCCRHSTPITVPLNAVALPPVRPWPRSPRTYAAPYAKRCASTWLIPAGQSRRRRSTELPAVDAKRAAGERPQKLGFGALSALRVLRQNRFHAAGPTGRKATASISIFAFRSRPATCTAVLVGGSFGKNSPRMRENTA
jgi:hypothetical protein